MNQSTFSVLGLMSWGIKQQVHTQKRGMTYFIDSEGLEGFFQTLLKVSTHGLT